MSLALMARQPRMLEPSKPRPSVKISSLYSVSVVVKCCQLPGRSVNLKSMSLTSRSLINLLTSEASLISLAIGWLSWNYSLGQNSRRRSAELVERKSERRRKWLDGFFADLFRADADRVFDWENENFAVTDFAGLGRAHDDLHGLVDHLIGEHDFDFHLRQKID